MSSPAAKKEAETREKRNRVNTYVHGRVSEFYANVLTDANVNPEAQRRSASADEIRTPEVAAEQAPEPMHLAVVSVNMTNENFVANADTIGTTFAMNPTLDGPDKARGAFGVLVDVVNAYGWTRAGVTVKSMKGKYNTPVSDEARLSVGRKIGCVQVLIEALRLPRDVKGREFDDLLRVHFLPVMSKANKTEQLDSVPMELVFQLRHAFIKCLESEQKKQGIAASDLVPFKMGMTENLDFASWRDHAPALKGEYTLPGSQIYSPEYAMGNFHVESIGNPRSEDWFSTIKDKESLKATLPKEDKYIVLKMREQIIDEANNPNLYLHRCNADSLGLDEGHVKEVFRPPHMEHVYMISREKFGKIDLPSQIIDQEPTPRALEFGAPSHVVLRDKCYLKIHYRGSNKQFFQDLRAK